MRKLICVLAVLLAAAVPMFSQASNKVEVFGGYQYTRLNPGSGITGENFNGWNASVTGNLNGWVGMTADLSGGYANVGGVNLKMYNFLFGPTLSSNKSETFKPFAHALFGVSHASGDVNVGNSFSASSSDNAFGMALGGGVDLAFHHNFAFRVIQADYLMTRFGSATQNNARISTGVVFKF
jgi:opacity protein-like surface antigen